MFDRNMGTKLAVKAAEFLQKIIEENAKDSKLMYKWCMKFCLFVCLFFKKQLQHDQIYEIYGTKYQSQTLKRTSYCVNSFYSCSNRNGIDT